MTKNIYQNNVKLSSDVSLNESENTCLRKCCAHISTITIPAGRLLGDVNYDGIIDGRDMDLVRDYAMGRIILEGDDLRAADVNDSKIVDTTDIDCANDVIYSTKHNVGRKTIDFLNEPNEGWKKIDDFDEQQEYPYIFSMTVNAPGVNSTSNVRITPKNFIPLKNSGMLSTVKLGEGEITFYTFRPPIADVECMLEVWDEGDGEGLLVIAADASFRPVPEEIDAAKCEIIYLILKSTKWYGNGPYKYDVENSKIKDGNVGIIGVVGGVSDYEAAKEAKIIVNGCDNGLLSISAIGVKPTQNITCQLIIFADRGGKVISTFPW